MPVSRPGDGALFVLVTACGLGLFPVAPGTVGTLGGVAVAVGAQLLWRDTVLALVLAALALVLLAVGCATSAFVARRFAGKDPSAFVLDEVVGHLLCVALATAVYGSLALAGHAAAFLLFRAFDVLKVPPARQLERLAGAPGIMLDDVAAGILAGACLIVILPFLR